MSERLKVTEHHGKSEVVRVDIEANHSPSIVIEYLSSQNCVVVDAVLASGERDRIAYYTTEEG